ncbi:uncharacterized protein LOC123546434 [Mercenaria mercenaria]|uniref:uncharacterized protein LOC123546434 n=1 Tax=Mercenaria mercenaria TaxID=6596 RepID=UPI00234FA50D|nr:uncharacterized protein LOC123546434 [Mercenaria mercenaria]
MMTLGLMKTYVVTSSNILKTMIPLIKTAVKLKKNAILKPMFMKVLKFSEEMRDEAIKTRQNYFELQNKIQKDAAEVNEANAMVEEKQKELETKQKFEEERKKKAQEKFKELEKQRKQKDEEVKQTKQMRDEMFKQSVDGQGGEMCKQFMEGIMTPKIPDVSGGATAMKGVFGVFGLVVNTVREHYKGKRALAATEQAQKMLNKASEDRSQIDSQMDSKEKETLEAGYNMAMFDLEKSSLGDLESLVAASEQLASIDGQLVNIITFWDNLAAFLKDLNQKGEVGECFLDAIEDDACAEMFNTELVKVEEGWVHFGSICREYVKTAEQSIPVVYGFLSQPIDKLGKEERSKRSKELIEMWKTKVAIGAAPEVPKLKDAN